MCAAALKVHVGPKSIGADLNIDAQFIKSFFSEGLSITDLTAAEELVRGLAFDKFKEEIYCKILRRIKEADFEAVVTRIATRHEIPEKIKEGILDGMYAETNEEMISEFEFEKGGTGQVIYGRILTVKGRDGTINLAYVLYYVEFKLSQKRIKERRPKKLLFFTIGHYTIVRLEDRDLSQKEKDQVFDFYRAKALKGFKDLSRGQLTAY